MKNAVSLLATVLIMSIFASFIFVRLNVWEKRMKEDVKRLAAETVRKTLEENKR